MRSESIPQIIAHRGNSSVAPENTLAAFASAIAAGAGSIEIDIMCTADGQIVIIHDENLDRTTNGTGAVAHTTAANLLELDAGGWFSPGYVGQRVPTFEEFAELLSAYEDVEGLVEFKGAWSNPDLAQALSVVRDHGIGEQVILQSFHPQTVMKLHALAPGIRRGVLAMADLEGLIDRCVDAGIYTLNPYLGYVSENPQIVAKIHEAGLRTQVWTANYPGEWSFLADLGVDGIITDRPDAMAGWLAA